LEAHVLSPDDFSKVATSSSADNFIPDSEESQSPRNGDQTPETGNKIPEIGAQDSDNTGIHIPDSGIHIPDSGIHIPTPTMKEKRKVTWRKRKAAAILGNPGLPEPKPEKKSADFLLAVVAALLVNSGISENSVKCTCGLDLLPTFFLHRFLYAHEEKFDIDGFDIRVPLFLKFFPALPSLLFPRSYPLYPLPSLLSPLSSLLHRLTSLLSVSPLSSILLPLSSILYPLASSSDPLILCPLFSPLLYSLSSLLLL
jgi:hypothetical protein